MNRGTSTTWSCLLEHAHDGLAVIDPGGVIVASTPSLDRLLGHEAGELVGVDGLSLIHPDDVEHVALRLAEYVGGGNDGPDVRTRIRRSDGTYAHVELVAPDSDPIDDEVGGIVLTIRDITQRREAEEALRDVRILHEAVASIAARFVDADPDSVDETHQPRARRCSAKRPRSTARTCSRSPTTSR